MQARLLTRTEQVKLLKNRVAAAKESLPANYKAIIFQQAPEYDTNLGVNKINNVLSLKSTDEKITEILENIAKQKGAVS